MAGVTLQEFLSGKSGGSSTVLPSGFRPLGSTDSLFENAVDNIGDIATGLIPGLAKLGGNALQDIAHAATLGAYGDQFKTDDNLTNMAKGWWGSSPIPSLLQGEFAEAGQRFHERPVDALLDFTGLGSLGVKGASKAGLAVATKGSVMGVPVNLSPEAATGIMHKLGYRQMAQPLTTTITPDVYEGMRQIAHSSDATQLGSLVNGPGMTALRAFRDDAARGTGISWKPESSVSFLDQIKGGSVQLLDKDGVEFSSTVHGGLPKLSTVIPSASNPLDASMWKRQTHRMIGPQVLSKAPESLSKRLPEDIDTQALLDQAKAYTPSGEHGSFLDEGSELGVMSRIPRSKWEHIARMRDFAEDVYAKHVPDDQRLLGFGVGNLYRAGRIKAKDGMTALHSGAATTQVLGERARDDLYKGLDKKHYEAADLAAFLKEQGMESPDRLYEGLSHVASGKSTLNTLKDLHQVLLDRKNMLGVADNKSIFDIEQRIGKLRDRVVTSQRGSRILATPNIKEAINNLEETPNEFAVSNLIADIENRINTVTPNKTVEDIVNTYGDGGVRTLAKKIDDNRAKTLELMSDEERMNNWMEFATEMSAKAEQYAKANYSGVLDNLSVDQNRYKLWTLLYGTDDLNAIKSLPDGPGPDFKPIYRTSQGSAKRRDEDLPDMGFEPGNKLEHQNRPPESSQWGSIIDGSLRLDPLVHTDNLKNVKTEFARRRFVEEIGSVGVNLTTKELSDLISRGLVNKKGSLTSGDVSGPITPFVRVKDTELSDKIADNLLMMEDLAKRMDESGNPHGAIMIRKDIEDGPMADILATHGDITKADLKAAMANPTTFRKLMEEGGPTHTIIPRQYYEPLAELTKRDSTTMMAILDNTSQWWKQMVLHWRAPTWMRNNAISNIIISALSSSPKKNVEAFFNHLEGARKLAKTFKGDEWYKQASDTTNVMKRDMPEVLVGQGTTSLFMDKMARNSDNKAMQGYLNMVGAVAQINAKWVDDPWRGLNMHTHAMDLLDSYKEHALAGGVKLDELPSDDIILQEMLRHDGIRQWLGDQTLSDMINFQDMGPWERRVIYRMLPFWSWIKGMNKRAARMANESPELIAGQSAVADVGNEWVEEEIGPNLPSFLKSQIPIGDEGYSINLGGANPFQTPADMAKLIASYIPGGPRGTNFGSENLLGMTHPLLKAPIEAQTRRDIFTGQPLSDNSMNTGELLLSRATNVPIMQFLPYGNPLDALFSSNRDATPPFMRPSTLRSTTDRSGTRSLAAYLTGVNVAKVRPYAAQERGLEEYMDRYS